MVINMTVAQMITNRTQATHVAASFRPTLKFGTDSYQSYNAHFQQVKYTALWAIMQQRESWSETLISNSQILSYILVKTLQTDSARTTCNTLW